MRPLFDKQQNEYPAPAVNIRRFETNPIIHPGMPGLEGDRGQNINGPSLIKVPDWLPDPLGKYYLYFAHHGGKYIRLAYADELAGPWTVYEPGTLRLEQTPCRGHIASPDVHILDDEEQLRMYFHGPVDESWKSEIFGQCSFIAHSSDGINFESGSKPFGIFYYRVFRYGGHYYAVGKNGSDNSMLSRSADGVSRFEDGSRFLPGSRHSAVRIVGDTLELYYSTVRQAPERIYRSTIDLAQDWMNWLPQNEVEILRPETDYEGADKPLEESSYGRVMGEVNQLRDPGIYEEDGRTYLLYSVAGEYGLGIAELES